MNEQLLTEIGLTEPQAKAYLNLVQYGPTAPTALADRIGESRTNVYKIMDKLVETGLAHKDERNSKIVYRVGNPVALEALARSRRDAAMAHERRVQDALPSLLSFFHTYSEQPGVRFYQGQDGIRHIFEDMLRTRQDIYLLRSPADVRFYDEVFFEKFRRKRAELGIQTHALTPNVATAVHNEDVDKRNNFSRTWLPAEAYTANVEWDIYGDKVALISYGEEAMGMIIESPQIAESFRQMFKLLAASRPA